MSHKSRTGSGQMLVKRYDLKVFAYHLFYFYGYSTNYACKQAQQKSINQTKTNKNGDDKMI